MVRLLLVALIPACASPAETGPASVSDGPWEGPRLRFTRAGAEVRDLVALGVGCGKPGCPAPGDIPLGNTAVTRGGSFTASGDAIAVEGTFADDTAASGLIDLHPEGACSCHVLIPWTATFQGPVPVDCSTLPAEAPPSASASIAATDAGSFRPLADGDDVDIIFGFQGSFMLVLGAEAAGFDITGVTLRYTAVVDGAEVAQFATKKPKWTSGTTRVEGLPVVLAEDAVALNGKAAALTLRIDNPCGLVVERTVTVTLRWLAGPSGG